MSLWYHSRYESLAKWLPRSTLKRIVWYFIRDRISKADCWFVDIPRTASTSIKCELREQFGWPYGPASRKYRTDFLRRHVLPFMADYSTAQHMRMLLGDHLWQEIFTFSIIRNPWSRYLSLFFSGNLFFFEIATLPSPIILKPIFKHWLAYSFSEKGSAIKPAREYLLDEDGNMIVDFVARYENRQKDFAYIGQKINHPELGKNFHLMSRMPKEYHYSEYYDSESRDLVAEAAKWEIEKFNYSFEE